MRGLHSCREGKDMTGDNFNEKQYYKGKITEIINKCENLNYLEIAYEFLKSKSNFKIRAEKISGTFFDFTLDKPA